MMGGRGSGPSEIEVKAVSALRRMCKAARREGRPVDPEAIEVIHKVAERRKDDLRFNRQYRRNHFYA